MIKPAECLRVAYDVDCTYSSLSSLALAGQDGAQLLQTQTYDRFFMKLFLTTHINTVKDCQEYFCVSLPSCLIEKRTERFLTKVNWS